MLEAGWTGKRDLKVLCGGEAMPRDLAVALIGKVAQLWNMYGPTETTIWSTVSRILERVQAPSRSATRSPIRGSTCSMRPGGQRPSG